MALTVCLFCLSLHTSAAEPAASSTATLSGAAGMERMQAARDEVANVRSNIFLTLVELDRVRGERDPQHPKFRAFTNQVAVMEGVCKKFAKRAEEMKQRGDAYFADWETRTAALNSAEARQQAEKRMAERKRSYDAINGFMQEARENFLSFFKQVTEIKTLLEGKRDDKSIAQAKQLMSQANWRCIDTQRALMNIEDEFDRLAESFASEPAGRKGQEASKQR